MWKSYLLCISVVLLLSCSDKPSAPPNLVSSSSSNEIPYMGNSPIRIVEITPVNLNYYDHQGDDPAWVEFENVSDSSVNLQGFKLTNDISQPERWVMGDFLLAPKSRQIVFLSGKNISSMIPRGDSISLMNNQGYSWSDGDRSVADGPAGNSSVKPYGQKEIFEELNVGATLTLGDNSELPSNLQWSTAIVSMSVPEGEVSLLNCNTLVLKGYVQEGRELMVRLVQPDVDDWLGWGETIRGNGKKDTEYRIPLPKGTLLPDLAHIIAVKFEAPSPYLSSVSFQFNKVYALNDPVIMHASFEINRKAGTLWLIDKDSLAIRDSLAYPDMPPGTAWGYDSLGTLGYLSTPTPNSISKSNSYSAQTSSQQTVQLPGFYASPIAVSFEAIEGATIHYTIDGSAPNQNSPIYLNPIPISKTTVVRSMVIKSGELPSAVQTQTFFIADSATLPVVAITTSPGSLFDPDTGIYELGPNPGNSNPYWGANFWAPKELEVSIEFFEKGGKLAWHQNAGMSIFGNWSRANAKKSMSIKFREEYGKPKLEYPLFPDAPHLREFKTFGLRSNGGNATVDYVRDPLAQELVKDLGVDIQYSRPVVVYYNGEYFGIHRLVQKSDKYYAETVHGVPEQQQDFIEAYGPPKVGSGQSYTELLEYLNITPASQTFSRLDSIIDLDEYLNYLAAEIYANNTDWPQNNWRAWRGTNPVTGWRFLMFDVDFGFGSPNGGKPVTFNMFPFVTNTVGEEWPNGATSTQLIRGVLTNPITRAMFINRMAVLLNSHFSANTVIAKLTKMTNELQSQQARDLERWGYDPDVWTENWNVIHDFATQRAGLVRSQMRTFFNLGADITATLVGSTSGIITVEGLRIPSTHYQGVWFDGHAVQLKAVPVKGKTFLGWSDGEKSAARSWTPQAGQTLTAQFR